MEKERQGDSWGSDSDNPDTGWWSLMANGRVSVGFWSTFSRRWAACARLEHFLNLKLSLVKEITEVKRESCSFCSTEAVYHGNVCVRTAKQVHLSAVSQKGHQGAPGLSEAPHLPWLFSHQKQGATVPCRA